MKIYLSQFHGKTGSRFPIPVKGVAVLQVSSDKRQTVEIKLMQFCDVRCAAVFNVWSPSCYNAKKLYYTSIIITSIGVGVMAQKDQCPLIRSGGGWRKDEARPLVGAVHVPTSATSHILHYVTQPAKQLAYLTFAAAGPRLWNSLPVQLRNPDITYGLFRPSDDSWRHTFFGKHEHYGALWLWYAAP